MNFHINRPTARVQSSYTELANGLTGAHNLDFDAELCWELARCAFHSGAADLFHQWVDRYVAQLKPSELAALPVDHCYLINLADSMRDIPPRAPSEDIDPGVA